MNAAMKAGQVGNLGDGRSVIWYNRRLFSSGLVCHHGNWPRAVTPQLAADVTAVDGERAMLAQGLRSLASLTD